ncbi:MAG: hypothetical protein ACTSQG_07100 [Promethearchaeota archaeon]
MDKDKNNSKDWGKLISNKLKTIKINIGDISWAYDLLKWNKNAKKSR